MDTSIRLKNPRRNLSGLRFGKLTAVYWTGNSRWFCICDCGKPTVVITANLKRGNTTSCGCIRKIAASKRATTHGLSNTPAYKTWLGIRRRCLDSRHDGYKYYGARGIGIYSEWAKDPVVFINHV